MNLLDVIALGLSACSIVMLGVLVSRRMFLTSRERHRARVQEGLREVALELVHAGTPPPPELSAERKEALADLLARYARAIRGSTRERIIEYFAGDGTIDRERSVLAEGGQAWRRATAAFRLGDIGNDSVVPALMQALRDSDRGVRIAAVRSLGRLRASEAAAELVAAGAEYRVPGTLVRWALLQIGPPVLAQLRALLDATEPAERAAAVQLLGLLGGPADASAAAQRLHDSSALVRAQAAQALGRLGGERDLRDLLRALEDRIPAVREAAAGALGQLRDRRAMAALARHAEGDQFEVARASARSLARVDAAVAADRAARTGSVHLLEAVDLLASG